MTAIDFNLTGPVDIASMTDEQVMRAALYIYGPRSAAVTRVDHARCRAMVEAFADSHMQAHDNWVWMPEVVLTGGGSSVPT